MLLHNVEYFFEGYPGLVSAIVLQAIKDYQSALRKLQKDPKNKDAKYDIREIKRFFNSDWFMQICSLEGKQIPGIIEADFAEKYVKQI